MTKGGSLVLRLYFTVVSAVSIFILMYGLVDLLTIGFKQYVFKAADIPTYLESCDGYALSGLHGGDKPVPIAEGGDGLTPEERQAACEARNRASLENYKRQKADTAIRSLALIVVGLPLFAFHFRVVYKDWKDMKKA